MWLRQRYEMDAKSRQASSSSSSSVRARTRTENENGSLIDAAALQLDMARRFKLPGTRNPSRPRLNNRAGFVARNTVPSSNSQDKNSDSRQQQFKESLSQKNQERINRKPVSCGACNFTNMSDEDICHSCGYFLAGAPAPPKETLAQRRGLVEAPPKCDMPVNICTWNAIESKLSSSRNDAFCPICMEAFNQGSEVLLSCSHIFHSACLQAFEKFMKSDAIACPICRTSNYQKKITRVGSKAFELCCIIKLQTCFRGYCARSVFRINLKSYYTSGRGKGSLQRRRFYEKEFNILTDSIAKKTEAREKGLDNICQEMDTTLRAGNELDIEFERALQQRTKWKESLSDKVETITRLQDDHLKNEENSFTEDQWVLAVQKAKHFIQSRGFLLSSSSLSSSTE